MDGCRAAVAAIRSNEICLVNRRCGGSRTGWLETLTNDLIAYAKGEGEDSDDRRRQPRSRQNERELVRIVPAELRLPRDVPRRDLLERRVFPWRTGRDYVGLGPGGSHLIETEPGAEPAKRRKA